MLPHIRYIMGDFKSSLLCNVRDDIDVLEDLCELVERAIIEETADLYSRRQSDPRRISRGGGPSAPGKDGRETWLADLEAKEREKTGIKNMKIKYNRVFGYYLEVTNSYKDLVPDYYTRKQTLANAERYITPELKELEDIILGRRIVSFRWNTSYSARCAIRLPERSSAFRRRQRRSPGSTFSRRWRWLPSRITMSARR